MHNDSITTLTAKLNIVSTTSLVDRDNTLNRSQPSFALFSLQFQRLLSLNKLKLSGKFSEILSSNNDRRLVLLKREINACSPILKLPPEISLRFFMTAFPKNLFSDWGPSTPLLLGAICHEWRVLAWSFPLLWSSILFIAKHYSKIKNSLLQEWLARSRDLPLSICLRMFEPQRKTASKGVRKTMDIIARCSERWELIDFHLLCMFHPKICSVPTQFPLLISMSIHKAPLSYKYDKFISKLRGPQVVWDAPQLQYAYIDPSIGESLDLHPSLNQRTSFSWQGSPSPQRCLEILKDAPNLVKCQFRPGCTTIHHQLPSVMASQLETLEIGFDCMPITNRGDCISEFFNSLTASALRDVSISSYSDWYVSLSTVFISFISRSACHLLRLSLSNILIYPDELASCLSATPSLTELQLENIPMATTIFRVLSVKGTSQDILLPNLESFTYTCSGYFHYAFNFTDLLIMARSRLHFDPLISHVVKLKSICIDCSEQNNCDAREICIRRLFTRFRRLIAEGMDIRILGYDKADILKQNADM